VKPRCFDIVAELHADCAQSRDLTRKIVHDEVNAVPAAGPRALAIGHRSPGRACRAAERIPRDCIVLRLATPLQTEGEKSGSQETSLLGGKRIRTLGPTLTKVSAGVLRREIPEGLAGVPH
jgi:hypothetical protein